jgi:hypothetical protein
MVLYVCPHTSQYCCDICFQEGIFGVCTPQHRPTAYHYISVLILSNIGITSIWCPHATIYVSSYSYICVLIVVVRLFIDTQNRLVTLHSSLIKAHKEADISPHSVIYRPVGSPMQLVAKLSYPNFVVIQGHRYL